MQKPEPPPEAPLIRLVRLASRLTSAQAAAKAGISKARWSQVENGSEKRAGLWYPVSATDGLLAKMADAIGLTPCRLADAGREDAAAILREMNSRGSPDGTDEEMTPQCVVEREVIRTPGIPEDVKRDFVRKHRVRGHNDDCGPFRRAELAQGAGALRGAGS
jgi:transcriptional regulator with XRE-family HTH domain